MSEELPNNSFSIINAHTHIFKSDDVPSQLAKKMAPPPIPWLLNTHFIISISLWLKKINKKKHSFTSRNSLWQKYVSSKSLIFQGLRTILLILGNVLFGFYLLYVLQPVFCFSPMEDWLQLLFSNECYKFLLIFNHRISYIWVILFIFLFFEYIRNWFFKLIWALIKRRLGKQWVDLIFRYKNLINFSGYKSMSTVFSKLKLQYPPESKFVVLPMDMHFMNAGKPKRTYRKQMNKLIKIKKNNPDTFYPFIFAHPQRMIEIENRLPHFKGKLNENGQFLLENCDIKSYFEKGCAGVKIYPAIGYYVFDKELLPLWLYCAQNDIPIITHCSVGPIFYRGNLKKLSSTIDRHPVYTEIVGKNDNGEPMEELLRLPIQKNKVFQRNFTHPLNYLCLLEERLLKKVLDFHKDDELNLLFGYDTENVHKPLKRNLSSLKINLAHYGGSENWDQFLEQDRYNFANNIINSPSTGIDLPEKINNPHIIHSLWHHVDWFSVISSMIINYENVYTDISYTSHDLKYMNLLSQILDHPKISKRVLFGTDFYVVSNHKSEKHYWIDMHQSLGTQKWKLIANENPIHFLNL